MRSEQSWLQSLPLQSFQHLSDQKRCQLCFSCVCFFSPISMNSSQHNKQLSKKPPRSAKAELSCAIPIYIGQIHFCLTPEKHNSWCLHFLDSEDDLMA